MDGEVERRARKGRACGASVSMVKLPGAAPNCPAPARAKVHGRGYCGSKLAGRLIRHFGARTPVLLLLTATDKQKQSAKRKADLLQPVVCAGVDAKSIRPKY
jgi:hypothetical protein